MSRIPRWSPSAAILRQVLSRLDGALEIADLAALAGVTEQDVEAALAPLLASGVLVIGDLPAATAAAGSTRFSMVPPGIGGEGRRGSGELQVVDGVQRISEEEHARIAELYGRLNKIDHYRLLGVAATADTKDIKRSYYALAKLHHPDRFFRRDVGALRPKIDAIFAAMTTALETLIDPARRATYDAYLRDVLMTRIARRNAEALESRAEWTAAAEVWARVTEQLPMDPFIQHRYANAVLRGRVRDAFGPAVAAAARATELDPTRAEYRLTAASLYLATGRERSALAELEVACELEPDRSDIAGVYAAVSERVYARG